MTFNDIGEAYVCYVKKYYQSPIVIFDGYIRRNSVPQSSYVKIQENNAVPYTQDRFLSFNRNIEELLQFISTYLRNADVQVINRRGDADSTVALTALTFVTKKSKSVLL